MSPTRSRWPLLLALTLCGLPASLALVAPARATQQAPVSDSGPTALIDRLVAQRWTEKGVQPAALCDDRTFVRRIYLDLAGRIPTAAETDAFLSDTSASKRTVLVDRLLAGPEYAAHMRDIFDVVFTGRRPQGERRRRRQPEGGDFRRDWLAYLERSFAENRPWDATVRSLLLARPGNPEEKGAVWFLYARQEKYQEIAEAISPAVFGVQVQCAQCHDHPLAGEIKQAHYWGLVSFFNRGKNQNTKAGPRVVESAIGGFNNFASAFTGESHAAELTFLGADKIPEQRPADGVKEQDSPELYNPAAGDEPPVPKFSRREQFVERVVKANPLVARAAVNRFWALLLGRGLVHPVDKMDSKHPPSHPELLDALAQDFEKSGYDVKRLVRALVLSRAYQLDSRPVGNNPQPDLFAHALDKPLTAEMLYRSLMVAATGKTDAEQPDLQAALIEVFPDLFAEENIATLRQSMFLTNNPMVQQLVKPASGNTAERLAAISDPAARVREAFRAAYGRDPDADELKRSVAFLTARADRQPQATQQLWWALLTGAEFRFNH